MKNKISDKPVKLIFNAVYILDSGVERLQHKNDLILGNTFDFFIAAIRKCRLPP